MKYTKIALFSIVFFILAFIGTTFSLAQSLEDNGTTVGDNTPETQDNGTTENTLELEDNGTTAEDLELEDNGTTADDLVLEDNGTTADDTDTEDNGGTDNSNGGGGGGSGGGGRRSGGGSRSSGSSSADNNNDEVIISNIRVTLLGSEVPTTTLIRGETYTIYWNSSERGAQVSIVLAPVSGGSIIFIGTSTNPNTGVNQMNWTVPTSTSIGGNYILRFTDRSNHPTDVPDTYRIIYGLGRSGSGSGTLGTGGGILPSSAVSSLEVPEEEATITEVPTSESENIDPSQTASSIDAFKDFLNNKYVLWFFVLLLVIAGILLVRERKN
jgi:hypothetical protein